MFFNSEPKYNMNGTSRVHRKAVSPQSEHYPNKCHIGPAKLVLVPGQIQVSGHPGKFTYPGIRAIVSIRANMVELSGQKNLSGQRIYPGSCIYPGIRAIVSIRANGQCNLSGHPGSTTYPGIRATQSIRAVEIYPGSNGYPGKRSM